MNVHGSFVAEGSSQRPMDVVFKSVVNTLPSELRLALQSAGLADPGVLLHYPRTSADVLKSKGLGLHSMVTPSQSSVSSCLSFPLAPSTTLSSSVSPSPAPVLHTHLTTALFSHPQGPQVSSGFRTEPRHEVPIQDHQRAPEVPPGNGAVSC